MIGVIEYGAGNYGSVINAFRYLGIDTMPISSSKDLNAVRHVVLPGVGAFKACIDRLRARGLCDALQDVVREGDKHILGICVGMQMLASEGTEHGNAEGLGIIPGSVVPIQGNVRVPHIGWAELELSGRCPLFEGISGEDAFYFVHSFHFVPENCEHVSAVCQYGERFAAVVTKDTVTGVQFHPEKSQLAGLQLLRNFSRLS